MRGLDNIYLVITLQFPRDTLPGGDEQGAVDGMPAVKRTLKHRGCGFANGDAMRECCRRVFAAPSLNQAATIDCINSRFIQVDEQFSCSEFSH